MIRIGRLLSAVGILIVALLLLLSKQELSDVVNASPALLALTNTLGAIGAVALFGAWGLALYHWGCHFRGPSESKGRWGLVVVFGAFLGGWLYWFRGTR